MKKIILVLLILSMIFSGTVVCFAGQEQPEKNVIHYVSLGESNVLGLSLLEYYEASFDTCGGGFYKKVSAAYPALVAKMLEEKYNAEVQFDQLAISGSRVYDIRAILDTDIPLDKYFIGQNMFMADALKAFDEYQNVDVQAFSAEQVRSILHPIFEESVKNADIITLDSAENDLAGVPHRTLMGDTNPETDKLAYMIGDKEYAEIKKKIISRMEEAMPDFSENEILQFMTDLMDGVIWAYIDATFNFDNLVKTIYELNPDVELVIVDAVPSWDEKVVYDIPGVGNRVPLGKALKVLFDMVREYRRTLSPYASRYKFAELNNPETFFTELCGEDYAFKDLSPDTINGVKLSVKYIVPEDEWYRLEDSEQLEQIAGRIRKLLLTYLHHPSSPDPELLVHFADYLIGEKAEGECSAEELEAFSQSMADAFEIIAFFGGHPNAEGHKARANSIMNAIGSYLNARQSRFVEFGEESVGVIENRLSEKQNKMVETARKMSVVRIEIKNTICENICKTLSLIHSVTEDVWQRMKLPSFR